MQQNTLSSTLNLGAGDGGGGGGEMQDLEVACRLIDKHLSYDSSFPSLLERLRVAPQGICIIRPLWSWL